MQIFQTHPSFTLFFLPPRKVLSLTHCFSETALPSLQVPKNIQRTEVGCL